ncbi:hypothetical protein [Dictyobacter arantiisoli]|uniref:Uncharacterized protein n=1 Tax=Dictyobacter arantiisoli TaxID=2014874 RepID=A0A5A5THM7_9CHLR|nr:hypothetical protein [Dictyobacter arantiisoli]GCF10812.1 hypothetical protein KDI_43760 [Dictyobacter arantiisoli]
MTTIDAPRTTPTIHTLAQIFSEIERQVPGAPWVPLGNFQMDFFRNYSEHQASLLADPIQEQPHKPGPEATEQERELYQWAVFCAASAEYLAHTYGLEVPTWANDPAYSCLDDAWYFAPMAYEVESVKEREIATTPVEFARRNIFCGAKIHVDKHAEAQKFIERKRLKRLRKTA